MKAPDDAADRVFRQLQLWALGSDRPLVVGICGAQGSGKSTIVAAVARRLAEANRTAALLSLDDLYLSRARRQELARTVHPLLATRGVPGTHDVALGRRVIEDMVAGRPVRLPRFDKRTDEPHPADRWPRLNKAADVVLFEGWCVGAVAEAEASLECPVNRLEAEEDANGRWRRYVNAALDGPYRTLFAAIDRLVLLAAPGFDVVAGWRREQEHELQRQSDRLQDADDTRVMADDEIDRFVAHYERLTRTILKEMPARADLVLRLDAERRIAEER